MSGRADDYQQAFCNLHTKEDRQNFWVPYNEELLPELEQMITDCTTSNNQLVFAGHRGCGKSTLLGEFAQQIKDRYFTVFFSISDLIEMSKIDHINILFTIAVQLMAEAIEQKIAIAPDKKDKIFSWFRKHTRIETEELKAEVEAGFDLFSIFKGINARKKII